MPRLRLIGLILFVTAVLIAFAAAATQTTHIRFGPANRTLDPNASQSDTNIPADSQPPLVEFRNVPIVYPLAGVGALGLLLWFAPAAAQPTARPKRRRRSSRSRRRQK